MRRRPCIPDEEIERLKKKWRWSGWCWTLGQSVSFRDAVELLRADHFSLAAGGARVVKKGTTAKLNAPVKAEADDQEALRQVVAFYHETLQESSEALRYLESRGLTHPEMIAHFQLGLANRTLGDRSPDKNRREGAELRGTCRS